MNDRELIEIPSEKAFDVFTKEGGVEPYIDVVRKAVADFVPSVATEADRAIVRSTAFRVVRSRTYLEKVGKAVADEQKALPKRIDEARRRAKTALEEIEEKVRGPLTEWENAERGRKARHIDRIKNIENLAEWVERAAHSLEGKPISLLEGMKRTLADVEGTEVSAEACQEFEEEYAHAKARAIEILKEKIAAQEKRETELAELAQLRAEKEKRDAEEAERIRAEQAKEREAQAVREAEERVRQQERDAAAAREAELRTEATERDRKAQEQERALQAEKAAQEARERNTRHKGAVNRAAATEVAAIIRAHWSTDVAECTGKIAREIITAIAKGEVPAVSIRY